MKKSDGDLPQIGELVLIVGDKKNRRVWRKGKVVRHVKGKDGVVRGVILLHKGNDLERPIQLVCPLEIRSAVNEIPVAVEAVVEKGKKRKAAKEAEKKIRSCFGGLTKTLNI